MGIQEAAQVRSLFMSRVFFLYFLFSLGEGARRVRFAHADVLCLHTSMQMSGYGRIDDCDMERLCLGHGPMNQLQSSAAAGAWARIGASGDARRVR